MKLRKVWLFSISLLLCITCVFANYDSNTFADTLQSGWLIDEYGQVKQDDEGYFTYTIREDMVEADGTIVIDADPLAEYMEYMMRKNKNLGSTTKIPLKIINMSGKSITYKDYSFSTINWIPTGDIFIPEQTTPTLQNGYGYGWGQAWHDPYQMLIGNKISDMTLNAIGFDGYNVRSVIAPLRCINPAVISLFNASSATNVTLIQMNSLDQKIKEQNTFMNAAGISITLPADETRTYADFLKAYYDVTSLNELSFVEKTNIFGWGNEGSVNGKSGQSAITNYKGNRGGSDDFFIPATALHDGSLKHFQTWGIASMYNGSYNFSAIDYPYTKTYYLLESDPEVLALGYEYLYDRCMRITFDNVNQPLNVTGVESYDAQHTGMKKYIDKNEASNSAVATAMQQGTYLQDGEMLTIDTMEVYMDVPNAWNAFRYMDFGFNLTFATAKKETPSITDPTPEVKPEVQQPEHETAVKKPITIAPDAPYTGDYTRYEYYILLALFSCISLLYIGKKKMRS
ncbi:hypothetical protein LJC02_04480 [Breznakia sp. OttesenSCG-928-G09]|nr:hypothetical protein [Breznakia sp. OttesenSCG-928-G09]